MIKTDANPVLVLCTELLEKGQLPASRFSGRTMKALASMFDSGRLKKRSSGAGYVVEIADRVAFASFIDRTFKRATAGLASSSAGAANLIKWADTKGSRREGQTEGILARAFIPKKASLQSTVSDIGQLTASTGVAGFRLDLDSNLTLDGPLVVVENPELFWHWEDYQKSCTDTLLLKSGRASNLMLDWLAGSGMANVPINLAVDFDPTGLDEFVRFKRRLGDRVVLPLPDNIDELFSFFANRKLLRPIASAEKLVQLRKSADDTVQAVVQLIDKYRGCLEHEALLVSKGT